MSERYYKDKYMLAIYNEDDELCGVADNPTELAAIFNKKYNTVISSLTRKTKFLHNNEWCKIHLIKVEEEEK